MKFYADLYGHVKPQEVRKKGRKRAAFDEESADTPQAGDAATAAAQEDSKKKMEAYLGFMKELCGGDSEGERIGGLLTTCH